MTKTIYALILWDYKPGRTSIYKLAFTKEELLEEVRDDYRDSHLEDIMGDQECSEEEANKIVDNLSYEYLEDWMYEDSSFVIDSSTIEI